MSKKLAAAAAAGGLLVQIAVAAALVVTIAAAVTQAANSREIDAIVADLTTTHTCMRLTENEPDDHMRATVREEGAQLIVICSLIKGDLTQCPVSLYVFSDPGQALVYAGERHVRYSMNKHPVIYQRGTWVLDGTDCVQAAIPLGHKYGGLRTG